tara:strand:+ start:227 stop:376 length:150 start_codon:yes stop_codon:yes gene_type:complete
MNDVLENLAIIELVVDDLLRDHPGAAERLMLNEAAVDHALANIAKELEK